ncbi:cilia- and flagella-associated protein 20-like [Galleria mellonella]|uniref:Cilia- and flagella-associated protein 20-like n=1 Tax=Galleria mellonella TaxID=7137 RepID=A0ABM3MX07_GALME|nr:cilia- and flagella-associated protein 20-like [Galleria mellonella]
MFKNTYQNGLLSIFYSCGSNPLAIWDMEVKNGHIKRITDNEVNSIVLEIVSTNVATTYITCPNRNQVLGIKLPFLVMIVKNLKRYFSFEITILDDKNMRRRFRISNFQSTTKIKPFCTSMPIGLSGGWNQIQFNLADFTRRAYGTQFIETLRVQVHANVRIRRIYFSERLYSEEELPQDYKLFLPLERKQKISKITRKEGAAPNAAVLSQPPAAVPAPAEAPPSESTPVEVPLPESIKEEVSKKVSEVIVTPAATEVEEENPAEIEAALDALEVPIDEFAEASEPSAEIEDAEDQIEEAIAEEVPVEE